MCHAIIIDGGPFLDYNKITLLLPLLLILRLIEKLFIFVRQKYLLNYHFQ